MGIVPWLSFGIALAGAMVGWAIASYKSGQNKVLNSAMVRLDHHDRRLTKIEQDDVSVAVGLQEIRSDLKYLRLGQERLESAMKQLTPGKARRT